MNHGNEVYLARCNQEERRRAFALECAVEIGGMSATEKAKFVVQDAKAFEAYLKGDKK